MNYLLLSRIAAWIAAIILGQTLYFKFTGAPEAKFIFSTIGLEPVGRWLVGIGELLSVILLIIPKTSFYGAGLALLIVIPAIFFHLTKLGISVNNDHGLLFGLAIAVLVLSIFIMWARWPFS